MHKSFTFATGSHYEGFYNTSLHCMEGFGRYLFPDGSEYRGYFKRGKFHGFGRIRMAPPFQFTFIGEFEDGELVELDEMIYPDGLHLFATLTPDGLNTDKWPYCTGKDRRYTNEICVGIDPVSPLCNETKNRPPRDLMPGSYDTEEGVYVPSTGFVAQIPKPFFKNRFVGCQKEINWIKKMCRRAPVEKNVKVTEPEEEFGRRIIDTNIQSMIDLGLTMQTCPCLGEHNRPVHVPRWCRKLYRDQNRASSSTSTSDSEGSGDEVKSPPTSHSGSSICDFRIPINLHDKCADAMATLKMEEPGSSD